MKRPMFYILIFFVIGILFGQYFPFREGIALFLTVIVFVGVAVATIHRVYGAILLPVASLCGFAVACMANPVENEALKQWISANDIVFVQGVVYDRGVEKDGQRKIVVDCTEIFDDNKSVDMNCRIYFYTEENLEVGQEVVVMGSVFNIKPKMNVSDFDMINYCRARKILYGADPIKITSIGLNKGFLYYADRIKTKFMQVYDKIFPVKEAGLMKAIMLGEKDSIDEEIYDSFRMAGVAHIVAVSGLHIGIFAVIVLFLTKRLPKIVSTAVTIFVIALYCIFTGCSASAVRALIMISIMLAGRLLSRDYDVVSAACLAAVILLFYSPYYIYDLGFKYSFCSVTAIGFAGDIIQKYKIKNKGIRAVIIAMAAGLAGKPISMLYSYTINVFDIISNLLVTGLMTVVFASGFVGGLVGLVSTHAGRVAAFPAYILLRYFQLVCDAVDRLPLANLATSGISAGTAIFIYILMFFVYNILMDGINSYAAALIFCLSLTRASSKENIFKMDFLYVGQGDCCVMETDEGFCIFDGGDNRFQNYGQYNLLPYLRYKGVNCVDKVFISHTDSDHIGGIIEIADDIKIKDLYFSAYVNKNKDYYTLCGKAEKYGTKIHFLEKGSNVEMADGTNIHCVADGIGLRGNDNSIVLKVEHNNLSVLMPGDIEQAAERAIGTEAAADVIKVPHHGSATSSSQEFLSKVNPKAAIASAGINNIYNHPVEQIVEGYTQRGIPFFVTNKNGQITLTEKPGGFKIKYFIGDGEYETD